MLTRRNLQIASIAAVVLLLVSGLVYVNKVHVADLVWHGFRAGKVAYTLDPTAERARTIGDYYFNWSGEGAYDLEKAKFYYNEALLLDSNTNGPWYQLARIDFLEGNFHSAIYKFNKQIRLHSDTQDPFYDRAHYVRGLTYGYMKLFDRAETDFLGLIERNGESSHWAYYVDLGWFYFSQGKFEELRQISEQGVQYYPDNPWILSNLGLALLNLGEPEKAVPSLEKALEEAEKLTIDDWERAYPGNDPRLAEQGLNEMIKALNDNLILAVDKSSSK